MAITKIMVTFVADFLYVMRINIIAAVAQDRAIGYKNKLIYWLPDDLKRFKALTTGHTIVMGRRTYESLPKGALPNRRNIVLSRSACNPATPGEAGKGLSERYPNCEVYASLEEAISHCAPEEDIYIIGGASIYGQALPMADRLCLTEIADTPAEADTFFPDYSQGWRETWREDHPADERHSHAFAFVDYEKDER